jgi:acetyl-CoA carboxylase biotin carboxyl carrier protein
MPKSGEQPSDPRRRSGTGRRVKEAAGRSGRPAAATHGEDVESGVEVYRNGKSAPARAMIELDFLRALVAVVDESGIDSLEITRAGTRIRISKTPTPVVAAGAPAVPGMIPPIAAPSAAVPAIPPAPPVAAPPEAPAAVPEAAPEPEPAPARELVEVRSPMVGTFYRAPAPEAPPYVEVGSVVTKGQTLCILEAMKLMNELESEVDGIVREILVENAEPVEYGQVLFRIEPRS